MGKADKTEQKLLDALDRLLAGESKNTDGKITQSNIAAEAGLSRATFNRYTNAVAEYRRVKNRNTSEKVDRPFTIEDKNLALQEENTVLRRKLIQFETALNERLASARQEIYVLRRALQFRDQLIEKKDSQIAALNRHIGENQKNNLRKIETTNVAKN